MIREFFHNGISVFSLVNYKYHHSIQVWFGLPF